MHPRQLRCTTTVLVLLMLGIAVSAAQAADGGNSANAKLCQKHGWMGLHTATGASFASQGECVAYAARGGALSPTTTASLVFDLGTCPLNEFGTFTCADITLVGSGLLPGDLVYECTGDAEVPRGFCYPVFEVLPDGTLPHVISSLTCGPGLVYTFSATAADGAFITSSDTC